MVWPGGRIRMSQIFIGFNGTGPIPPMIPTTFTADDGNLGVPALNNLNIFTETTTDYNAKGIQTTTNPNPSDNFIIQLTNRRTVSATTSDGGGQTKTARIFTPNDATGIVFVVTFIGYDATNNKITGGELVGIARSSVAGFVEIIGTNDTFAESDPTLVSADWNIITDGTDILAEFIGVAGTTIVWSATLVYDQSP